MQYLPVLLILGALLGFALWLFLRPEEDEDHWAGDHPD